MKQLAAIPTIIVVVLIWAATFVHAATKDAMDSVVSVLPVWPGQAQGGAGAPPGTAPEGSGVVLPGGVIATAWHVIEPADSIDIRLSDGRILPAKLLAKDVSTDIALLKVDADIPAIAIGPAPEVTAPVCAIGNAYGFGLSVTCGVVSATAVTNAGFNEVEDFLQTDASVNPGMSGGALVDENGQLVGMISAIFSSKSETNIGINFAVSTPLLLRVTDALLAEGEVRYPAPGWQLEQPDRKQMAIHAGAQVRSLKADSPAASAGIREGDLIIRIGNRPITKPRDAVSALAILPDVVATVELEISRNGETIIARMGLEQSLSATDGKVAVPLGDCPHPEPVCRMRQAVFPVSSFDPVASATRIGPDLLVTNRHIVGDRMDAIVHTPDGPRGARVVPSGYTGDLVLLEVSGLPDGGIIPDLIADNNEPSEFYTVGADISLKQVRVFDPGGLIAEPSDSSELARLHVAARMQPGVSGGALVDGSGDLVAIAVGGGEGRFEAIPVLQVQTLLELRVSPDAEDVTSRLGNAFADCAQGLESIQNAQQGNVAGEEITKICTAAANYGQLLEAGRTLAQLGEFDDAVTTLDKAVEQVPNSINARLSLLVALQLSARFEEMTSHARRLMQLVPDDPQALRFAIQSGVWGGEPTLAEDGYQALLKADPRQAEAARRFIDNAPPAPKRR